MEISSNPRLKTVSLWSFFWGPPLAVIVPRRLFSGIGAQGKLNWSYAPVSLCLLSPVCVALHFKVVFGVWVSDVFQTDWTAFLAGWTLYGVNVWLLCLSVLMVLNYLLKGKASASEMGLASYYFFVAIALIAWTVDGIFSFFGLVSWRVPVAFMPWVDGEVVQNWVRPSHFFIIPWSCVGLWHIFRSVLRLSGARQAALAALLAITFPILGRLTLYSSPNILSPLVGDMLGWQLSNGWMILMTQVLITAGVLVFIACFVWRCRNAMVDVVS